MEALLARAVGLGHRVEFTPLHVHSGLLMPNKLILINSQRSEGTQRITLAHELGHVYYGHDWLLTPHSKPRDERQADIYASKLLISASEYAVAEVMYDNQASIAAELEVPLNMLELWLWHHAARYVRQSVLER